MMSGHYFVLTCCVGDAL